MYAAKSTARFCVISTVVLRGAVFGGGGRGYFRNFWVEMCHLDPGTLNLYQN